MTFDDVKDMRIGSEKVLSAWLDVRQVYPSEKRIMDSLVCWYDIGKQQCTNESMASNPTLRDLSGNGHDATCYNFAWSGMSGVGGYNLDASLISPNQSDRINMEVSGSTVTYSRVNPTLNISEGSVLLYVNITNNDLPVNGEYGIKAGEYGCVVYQAEPANTSNITLLSLQPYETGKFTINQKELDNGKMMLMFGNSVEIPAGGSGSFELLPLYPNALVSDGVDDYAKVTGLPILTKERGYTIIAKRNLLNYNDGKQGMLVSKQYDDIVLNICIEQFTSSSITNNIAYCRSFGKYLSFPLDSIDKSFLVQTSKKYNGIQYNGEATTSDTPYLFLFSSGTGWNLKSVLYSFLLFDRDLTDAEIEWVKENMVEADGMMMYDWMYKFRLHNTDTKKRCDGTLTSYKITVTDVYTTSRFMESTLRAYEYYNSYKIKVTGLPIGVKLKYTADDTVIFEISSDGVYMLPAIGGTYNYVGFQFDKTFNGKDVTIQQLLTSWDQPLDSSLVDAWIFSGHTNEEAPYQIAGEKGINLICYNFAWNDEGSGFKDGALYFDGVEDFVRLIDFAHDKYTIIISCTINKINEGKTTYIIGQNQNGAITDLTLAVNAEGSLFYQSGTRYNDVTSFNKDVNVLTKTEFNGESILHNDRDRGIVIKLATNDNVNFSNIRMQYIAIYSENLEYQKAEQEIKKLEALWNSRLNNNNETSK